MHNALAVSAGIRLRPFESADIPNMRLYLNEDLIYNNTLHIPNPYTQADAEQWIEKTVQNAVLYGQTVNWAIDYEGTGLIGGIGAMVKNGIEGHLDEIGYWLAEPFRNQGIATAAVRTLSKHIFATRPLVRIEAHVFAHNPASGRVLEKAGYSREGFLRKCFLKKGQYIDAVLYALIREG